MEREWKLDKLLKKAYDRGVVLSGVSAGAICWFDKGVTDSWASNLNLIDCMGILKWQLLPSLIILKKIESLAYIDL